MEIKIEKGIPIPKQPRPSKYPFAQLEVGDSFFVAAENGNVVRLADKMRVNGYNIGARLTRKFKVFKVDGGVRVWRSE